MQLPDIIVKVIVQLFYKREMSFFNNNQLKATRHGYRGLAQGSVSLLYNLYTDQIDKCILQEVKIIQYADDVVVYLLGKDSK